MEGPTACAELLDAPTVGHRSKEQVRWRSVCARSQETTQMIIECCTKEEPAVDSNCKADAVSEVVPERCRVCGEQGAPVSRKTVLLMLKPDLLEQALTGIFRF